MANVKTGRRRYSNPTDGGAGGGSTGGGVPASAGFDPSQLSANGDTAVPPPPGNNGQNLPVGAAPPANDGAFQSGPGGTGQTDYMKQANSNIQSIGERGNSLNDETGSQVQDYGNQESKYRNSADAAASDLQQTPGYNASESAQIGQDFGANKTGQVGYNDTFLTKDEQGGILGNTDAAKGYYNPDSLTNETNAGNAAGSDATSRYQAGLNGSFDPSKLSMSQGYGDTLNGAVDSEGKAVGGALSTEAAGLNGAVDPSKLGMSSDYAKTEQLTPQQQQDMVTAAGTTVGNQSRTQQDEIARRAAADGNSSPAAIAAAMSRNKLQGDADAGDAMTKARIDASNAAAARAQSVENTRLGTEQDISGRQMSNAQTLGQQGTAAAENLAGTKIGVGNAMENTRLGANQDIANRQMTAAQAGGQAGITQANTNTNRTLATDTANQATGQNLAHQADVEQSQREAALAAQRTGASATENASKFNQGNTTAQENSQGAQTTGNARIAGDTSYRNYLTSQQGAAQSGKQTATGQQIQNFGTQTQGTNAATATGSQAATAKAGQPTTGDKIIGGVTGALGGLASFLEDGGIATEPTLAVVGENGPEEVKDMSQTGSGETDHEDSGLPGGDPTNEDPHTGLQKLGSKIKARYSNPASQSQQQPISGQQPAQAGSPAMYSNLGSSIGKIAGSFLEDGGTATGPTPAVVGENGPEAVVPVGPQSGGIQPGAGGAAPMPPTFNGLPETQQTGPAPMTPSTPALQAGAGGAAPPPAQSPGVQMGAGGAAPQPTTQPPATPPAASSPFLAQKPTRYNPTPQQPQAAKPPVSTSPQSQQPAGGAMNSPQKAPVATPARSGNVFTKPTYVMLGEDHPEAVVPLNPTAKSKITPSMMGMGRYKGGQVGGHALAVLGANRIGL